MAGVLLLSLFQTVWNSSISELHSTCDSLWIDSSLIDNGRLRITIKVFRRSFRDSFIVNQKTSSICIKEWGGS